MRSNPPQPVRLDDAIDAIVEPRAAEFVVRPEDVYQPPPVFGFQPPAPAQYVVPTRFGMSGIFGIMTALAVLFACFRMYNAHPVLYLFFGMQSFVICLAQMFYGKTPRAASAVSGAIILPVFLLIAAAFVPARNRGEFIACTIFGSVPIGAFLGYLTGTLAAGVFLVMDYVEPLLTGESPKSAGRKP